MFKTSFLAVTLLLTLAPLVPAADAAECELDCVAICPDCICWDCIEPCTKLLGCPPTIPPCVNTVPARVCAYQDPYTGCYVVSAEVRERTYVVSYYVPGQGFSTRPIDVGPVHVDSITVWTDPIQVGPYSVTTPGKSVSNTLCDDAAGLA
ncbi:MAG TPA: hypothetical protein VHH36_08340 [Candidatus Thermoplasmatota archaeon]|nr:hypothetical protein [Candidatus Thermoplasmatota archaeon]